jgi:glycosyltransferase involved in cell wall biosynthesis
VTPARPLRIAQVAPPIETVPPAAYGGTERVIHELVAELIARGHHVTTFASGDSDVPGELVPTVDEALRPADRGPEVPHWVNRTMQLVLDRADDFDVIHSHLEWWSLLLSRLTSVPVASTFHGRLDLPWSRVLLENAPQGLVAISHNQASAHPDIDWTVVYNGLSLADAPFETHPSKALCFVGRVTPEKGIVEAIEIAEAAGRPLRIAAKVGATPTEREYHERVFTPALEAAGHSVEFLGELDERERDELFATSAAALMPGPWPEPFGLVAVEALACGTPIIARRVGALPEIIRDGVDGFFGDDVTEMAFRVEDVGRLDRAAIRRSVVERFSAAAMADGYEALYRRLLAGRAEPGVRADSGETGSRETGFGEAAAVGAAEHEPAAPTVLDRLRERAPA